MGIQNNPTDDNFNSLRDGNIDAVIISSDDNNDDDNYSDDEIYDGYQRIPSDFENEENSDNSENEDNLIESNKGTDEKTEDGDLDVGKVKSAMLNLKLPPESIPQWGAMLSDQDFIEAVRQTIKPKLQIAKSQNESSTPNENNDQFQNIEKNDKITLSSKKTLSK